MHPTYIASNNVTDIQQVCSFMMHTEHVPRWQQFHMAPTMLQLNSSATASVDIQNALYKAAVALSELPTTGVQ